MLYSRVSGGGAERGEACCFLRSPPFPWVASDVAAVSRPGHRTVVTDHDAIFAAIRVARVGGAFWLPSASGDGGGRVAADFDPWSIMEREGPVLADADDDLAIVAWLSGKVVIDTTGCSISVDRLRKTAIDRVESATYRNPFTGETADIADVIAVLEEWRRTLDINRGACATTGMAVWKRDHIARFLWDGTSSPVNLGNNDALERARSIGRALAYWPSRTAETMLAAARRNGVALWQIEDGFVRSTGLGAECHPPFSIIADPTGGIHYDPENSSELEWILASEVYDDKMTARAQELRERLVTERIGKYGVDRGQVQTRFPTERRSVLAVGQVEDDRSILLGGGGIRSNIEFLRRVRQCEPNAFIVYRPHPDVMAGHRRGHVDEVRLNGVVDHVDAGGSLLGLVERVDCVHVISSLTGFEAILRDRDVVVHGTPFYAGWGLTRDLGPVPARRHRTLTVDELVAGALIKAPRYLDPVTMLPCTVETLVARMVASPVPGKTLLTVFRAILGAVRRRLVLARGGDL